MLKNILGNIPPVTKNLLILNVLLFIVMMVLGSNGAELSNKLAAHYITSDEFQPYQIITHMFMHSSRSIFHLLFNMMILVMIGSHLERIWGAKKYFIVYFASGLGAFFLYNGIGVYQMSVLQDAIIQSDAYKTYGYSEFADFTDAIDGLPPGRYFSQWSYDMIQYMGLHNTSMVGASGALFGLLAAFGILFPNIPMQILFIPVPIKAKYLIGAYLAFEIYNSIYRPNDGTAHLAHVGGAIVGIIIVLIWRKQGKNFN